ncbi:MAG TPA: hypothetical protein VJC03_06875, partial [bacterium]|nr:hypothetical protein [bacterium]
VWHYDLCIMCGECERICTTQDGVKLVPEFALAGFKREDLKGTGKDCVLLFCPECGGIAGTKEQMDWITGVIGEKQTANLGLLNMKLQKLGIIDKTERNITLEKRDDYFTFLCPRCRHRAALYECR